MCPQDLHGGGHCPAEVDPEIAHLTEIRDREEAVRMDHVSCNLLWRVSSVSSFHVVFANWRYLSWRMTRQQSDKLALDLPISHPSLHSVSVSQYSLQIH